MRCPWHHACFSLRTGEAVGAPALDRWRAGSVERSGERIASPSKVERDPLAPTYPVERHTTSTPHRHRHRRRRAAGNGGGRDAAPTRLRRRASRCSTPSRTRRTTGRTSRRTISPATRRRSGFHCARTASTREHTSISCGHARRALDLPKRAVRAHERRDALDFDALLLATGAEPVRLPIPGARPAARALSALARRQPRHHRAAKSVEARGRDRRAASSVWRSPPRCARASSRSTSSRRKRCRSSA